MWNCEYYDCDMCGVVTVMCEVVRVLSVCRVSSSICELVPGGVCCGRSGECVCGSDAGSATSPRHHEPLPHSQSQSQDTHQ